ncbi:hypothetical protein [Pseudorhodoferax soli]|uniref:Uncharacterized protein n=1 Tax=Pseudorhodoferax soli TaxID=545864 RepID=A0A368XFF6_9BURK|nr:hypothetical protein [Pseudorhodoferax soli]RCW65758.1 hypothetical protein DES41_112209 [Pseudorhodoferax soli]
MQIENATLLATCAGRAAGAKEMLAHALVRQVKQALSAEPGVCLGQVKR